MIFLFQLHKQIKRFSIRELVVVCLTVAAQLKWKAQCCSERNWRRGNRRKLTLHSNKSCILYMKFVNENDFVLLRAMEVPRVVGMIQEFSFEWFFFLFLSVCFSHNKLE